MPDGKGIKLFEPDIKQGDEIQFMMRDSYEIASSAERNSTELMDNIKGDGRKAVFGLYIDCAGRTAQYSNSPVEEASKVQEVFNRYNTPLLGFYSGVEVAPLMGRSRGLDWTGVLLVFAER